MFRNALACQSKLTQAALSSFFAEVSSFDTKAAFSGSSTPALANHMMAAAPFF